MSEQKRQRVTRADGKAINLVQRRGHLSYCYNACCCGRVDRGFSPVPVALYKSEWLRRKLRNIVHMTKGGCLGPCTLANVVTLLFDGNSVWFHSMNEEWQILAVFDYIDSMVAADRFLLPPAELTENVFQFYTWKGGAIPSPSAPFIPTEGFVVLTHADTDLLTLHRAMQSLPEEFPKTLGLNLQAVKTEAHMAELLDREIAGARVILLRILGRPSSIPGFSELVSRVQKQGQHLMILSGTGDFNPEYAAASTVSPDILQASLNYLQAGGFVNMISLLQYLSDQLLMTGFGYDAPVILSAHGIYHPDLPEQSSYSDWLRIKDDTNPTVGITFYRAHYLSGNTCFIDALIRELDEQNLNVLPIYTSSLKDKTPGSDWPEAFQFFRQDGLTTIHVLVNTVSFSMLEGQTGSAKNGAESILSCLNVPILQAITSGMTRNAWETSSRGLNPLDTAMNVAIPEFDGRIITVPVSFKEKGRNVSGYEAMPDRIQRVAGLASSFGRLATLENRTKKIAFIFTNSSSKASQIGNAVGLDSPASLMTILQAMKAEDYQIGLLPATGTELIHALVERCSYDETYLTREQLKNALGRLPAAIYESWFKELPEPMQQAMVKQWGAAPGETYLENNELSFAGLEFGNVLVALQPPRGYGMDPDAIYHQPDLPPTHHYVAFYQWLRKVWGADAIVHVGKHGTLEWLPGKGIGLSQYCFPDAILGDMPLFYPFIINDPGEGAQAKRRAHAVVVDHLTPALTSADCYGELATLTQLVDEYYQVETLDPSKLPLLQGQIWELIKKTNLDKDLSVMLKRDHGDHVHEWDDELTPEGVPVGITEMEGKDIAHLIEDIDGYLCELGAAQIRNGLHILGQEPSGESLVDMLQALTRLSNIGVPSLPAEIARFFELDLNELLDSKGQRLFAVTPLLHQLAGRPVVTGADALEVIDELGKHLLLLLQKKRFNPAVVLSLIQETFGAEARADQVVAILQVLNWVCTTLIPNLSQTEDEVTNLLHGLSGGYIPAGPSGAPTRGMAHILPTGRNFYSVDPRALPSKAAWEVGQQLAREVLSRHLKETGVYPKHVAISIWGTSAMRTQGDDVAEILALLGVRPLWQVESRRVTGVELIPLAELKRPRIDVTTRISGFFRDAFPHLIDLIDEAVSLAIGADELAEDNYIRVQYLNDLEELTTADISIEEAEERAAYRIFGSPPGSYGAGILNMIQERNWEGDADFASTYINWGGYAYSRAASGTDARDEFKKRLAQVEIALHNQDNREHDIFDSDDYLQFHGGMIASIRSLTGKQPRSYFGDTQNPDRVAVRDLKEEVLRVFRSRVVNPKWLESIKKHGYKGGLELTTTVDYIFGYDATAQVMDDWMYEKIAETYALDSGMQDFFAVNNPWALQAITERLLEAAKREMWGASPETLEALQQLYLNNETALEEKNEVKQRS